MTLCTHCRLDDYDKSTGACPACGEVYIPLDKKYPCNGCKHGGKTSDMYPCRECINGDKKESFK